VGASPISHPKRFNDLAVFLAAWLLCKKAHLTVGFFAFRPTFPTAINHQFSWSTTLLIVHSVAHTRLANNNGLRFKRMSITRIRSATF
jgi:hypothetical protein